MHTRGEEIFNNSIQTRTSSWKKLLEERLQRAVIGLPERAGKNVSIYRIKGSKRPKSKCIFKATTPWLQLWSRRYGNLLSWDAADEGRRSPNLFLPLILKTRHWNEYNKIIIWVIINWSLSPDEARLGLPEPLNIYLYRGLVTTDPWGAWFDSESYLRYPLVLSSTWPTCYLWNPAENHQTNLIISTGYDSCCWGSEALEEHNFDFILLFCMSKMPYTCLWP